MSISGYGHPHTVADVPHYVRAKTPEALKQAMLANNLRLKAHVGYFDIQFVNGYWYGWYFYDFTKSTRPGGK